MIAIVLALLYQPTIVGGEWPRMEPSGRVSSRIGTIPTLDSPDGGCYLRPRRPVVGSSPFGEELRAVLLLESQVFLEPAVVAVAGIGVPSTFVTMDAGQSFEQARAVPLAAQLFDDLSSLVEASLDAPGVGQLPEWDC